MATKSLTIEIKGDAGDFTVAVKDAEKSTKGFEDSLGKGDDALGSFSERLSSIGDMAAGVFGGEAAMKGAELLGEKLTEAFDQALDLEVVNDKLSAQLGLTGPMAEEFGHIAGDLYANAYGESISDANEALKAVWQQGLGTLFQEDASQNEIEGITSRVMDLTAAFDQELNPTVNAVVQLVRTGLAGSAEEAFDILTRGFQQGVDASEDLLDTVKEYSTQFRDLGLTGTQAMGLLSQGLKAGARDADTVADALKEFAIRAKDGSDLTAEGFKVIGLNAKTMAEVFARGGPDAAAALDTVLDRLRAIPDPAKRSQTAISLFGTKAEDLQQALFALDPSTAVAAMGQVQGAAADMGATLADNASTRIEMFKRSLGSGLVDFLGGTVIPALENLADAGLSGIQTLMQWLEDHQEIFDGLKVAIGVGLVYALYALAAAMVPVIVSAWGLAAAVLAATWPFLLAGVAITALVAGVLWAYRNFEPFRNAVDAVGQALLWVWNTVLVPVAAWITGTLVPTIVMVAGKVGEFLGAIPGLIGKLPEIFGGIVDFFEELPGRVLGFLVNLAAQLPGWLAYAAGFIIGWLIGMAIQLPGMLNDWLAKFADWAFNLAVSLGVWLLQAGAALMVWVLSTSAALPGQLWSWLMQFLGWAGNLAAQLPGWLAGAAGAVLEWVKGIPGYVASAVSAAADIGKNIASSIWDGLKSMAGWLKDRAMDFARGILDGIKSALHIGSPSKDMIWVGQMMAQGVGIGMESEAGNLQRTVDSVVGGLRFPTGSMSARAGAGGYRPVDLSRSGIGGMTVNINVDGTVVATEEGIGRVVNRGLLAAQRQGVKMAWTTSG